MKNYSNFMEMCNSRNISNNSLVDFIKDYNDISGKINSVSITLNRWCNFKCEWCYAQYTPKNTEMDLDLAKDLVDLACVIGAKNVVLIGGEPTYYKNIFEIVKYIKDKSLNCFMASNGYRFYDKAYLKELENLGLDKISFSLKASTSDDYIKLSNKTTYNRILDAMSNLLISKIYVGYGFLVTQDNVDSIREVANLVKQFSKNGLAIGICKPNICMAEKVDSTHSINPHFMIKKLVDSYDEINDILNGALSIQNSFPICWWPKDFLSIVNERKQFMTGCSIVSGHGLSFDEFGNLLLCGHITDLYLGTYKKDFNNFNCIDFLNSHMVTEVKSKMLDLPSNDCVRCNKKIICKGGCPLNWFKQHTNDVVFPFI